LSQSSRAHRGTAVTLLEFLGSMNLAITLLMALAVASVIGTVLQQNQPYGDYVIKFGPFWFQVFKELGLFNIYGTGWFLGLLSFLLVSTAVCVYRNGPAMVRDMRQFRLDVQEKSLRGFHHRAEWEAPLAPTTALERAALYLRRRGYRVRRRDHGDHTVLAAMKGGTNRLGYLLSHLAIVVICLGGLIDGNLPLRFAELTGRIHPETRNLPVSKVPAASTLPADNAAFRGSVSIPEGGDANFVFLQSGAGYLLQKLPFTVKLKDFRIEHYPSGQPKSFESDLVIQDPDGKTALSRTIAVNHPLSYKGYHIYQASFADGGSLVELKVWPLSGKAAPPTVIDGRVNGSGRIQTPDGPMTVEFDNFKPFNIFPVEEGDKSGKKFRNYGPSVVFKLRNAAGEAREYVNYLSPVTFDGRAYYMSGVRSEPGEPYRYLSIPVDPQGGVGRFMRFRALAFDEPRVRREVIAVTRGQLGGDKAMAGKVGNAFIRLVRLFAQGGVDAVVKHIDATVPEADRAKVVRSYMELLQRVYGGLYLDLLKSEGVDVKSGISEADARFFDDAMQALSLLGPYGAPVYLQPTDYQQVQASGLEITRAPGRHVVYLGFIMLMAGVFLLFYVHHRRLWLWAKPEGDGVSLLFAGSGNRERVDFGPEFESLRSDLQQLSEKPSSEQS
jgi:cytochrome c biogenesis protein